MERTILVGVMVTLIALTNSANAEDAAEGAPASSGGQSSIVYVPSNMNELLAPGSNRYTPGIRMGTFLVMPKADASASFDDNVFATHAATKSDIITNIDTGVGVISDWSRHAIELYAGGGGSIYNDYDSENQGHANAGIAGVLDIQRGLWVKGYTKYALGYEPRGVGESTLALFDKPIQTQTYDGGLLVHKEFNRLWLEGGGMVQRQEYGNGEIGGVEIGQSFRDGTAYHATGRTGYEFSPKMSVFIEGDVSTRNFNDGRFDGDEYKALAGVRHEFTRLIYGEAAVGYIQYKSASGLSDIDTWSYRGQFRWEATPLISFGVVGSRDIGTPTDINGASNVIDSNIGLRADYAFRRDVTLTAGAGYGWSDYVDIDRIDNYLKMMAGAEYQFRPKLSLWANYAFTHYQSDADANVDYDKNVVMLGLRARY